MSIFSRTSRLVHARVGLYRPNRAAVLLAAADGRWPRFEPADRFAIGVGFAALAANKTTTPRWEALRELLREVATGMVAAGAGELPGDLIPLAPFELPGGNLRVVPWEDRPDTRCEAEIVQAPGGIVPRLVHEPKTAAPTVELSALATLVALAADATPDDRLLLAFGVEGMLAWYRESQRNTPPRQALAFAEAHATDRLTEIGRRFPEGL